jgi:hypothetical protein
MERAVFGFGAVEEGLKRVLQNFRRLLCVEVG